MKDERPGQDEQPAQPELPRQTEESEQPDLPDLSSFPIIHDAFFKYLLINMGFLMPMLLHFLPPGIVALLDRDRPPEVLDGHYVSDDFQTSQSDLLVKLYLKGGGYIFALIEHKSKHEASTIDQLYRYHSRIMERHGKEITAELGEAPTIIPIVFHHGEDKWTSPITHLPADSDAAKMDASQLMPEDFRGPFHHLLIRLSDYELEELPPDRELRAGLLALIGSRIPGGNRKMLEQIFTDLQDNRHLTWCVEQYIVHNWNTPAAEVRAVAKAVNSQDETGDRLMKTGADMLRDEGRVEGKAEGRVEGEAKVLAQQLQHKFGSVPPKVQNRLQQAAPEELETWSLRIFDAKSPEAIFSD